jgi:hypothetical protein
MTTIEIFRDGLESFLLSSFHNFLEKQEALNGTAEEELSELKRWLSDEVEPLFHGNKIPKEFTRFLHNISCRIEELEMISSNIILIKKDKI